MNNLAKLMKRVSTLLLSEPQALTHIMHAWDAASCICLSEIVNNYVCVIKLYAWKLPE